MTDPIRLLQIEDSDEDAELVIHRLRDTGCQMETERVETADQLRSALARARWDVIVADYRLPQFGALEALEIVQQSGLDLPFIVVSSTVGEEAVRLMRAGAHDYLLKDRLERLPTAIERQLREAELRRQKREGDEKLRAVRAELEALYANAPALMFIVDEALRVEKINAQAARFCGRAPEDCLGASICHLLRCPQSDGLPQNGCRDCALAQAFRGALRDGARHSAVELWCPSPEAKFNESSCLLFSIARMERGPAPRLLACAQDVTQLKQTEQSLQKTVDSLRTALGETQSLFQEMHHRVKNNLQIAASLLSMKARKKDGRFQAEDLKDCERRIKSMARIHEQLYSQKEMNQVDFAAYVAAIVPDLVASFGREQLIELSLEIGSAVLPINKSIPCGLILNELVTNAVKYAYPQGRGPLLVRLASVAGQVELTVADQGVGMLEEPSPRNGSLGMQLILALTKQLRGKVSFSAPPGTVVQLSFPLF